MKLSVMDDLVCLYVVEVCDKIILKLLVYPFLVCVCYFYFICDEE